MKVCRVTLKEAGHNWGGMYALLCLNAEPCASPGEPSMAGHMAVFCLFTVYQTGGSQVQQANIIPIDAVRDVELHFTDRDGRAVILPEAVAVRRHVTQPIMC